MVTTQNEPDEIEKILSEKKELIERKKQGIENCKIPYVEAIAKLTYPSDFQESTNIEEKDYIIVRNGSKLKAMCRDCERKDSIVQGDFKELADYCLTVSPGVWVEAFDKPQSQIRHENKVGFKPHNHNSLKNPKTYVSTQPVIMVKLKDHERLLDIWKECWLRLDKQRKELQVLEKTA